MLAAATTAVPIPIWTFFAFIMASQMGLYGLFVRSLFASRKEKKKNGNCTKNITVTTPEIIPHEHEYVTTQMCEQTQKTIRAEVRILGVEVSHVKEIVGRFEETHKNEHNIMVIHFDQNMEQLKELITKNS